MQISGDIAFTDFRKYPWYIWVCVAAAGFVVLGVIIMGAMALREPCETDFHEILAPVLLYRLNVENVKNEKLDKKRLEEENENFKRRYFELSDYQNAYLLAGTMDMEELSALYSKTPKQLKDFFLNESENEK